MKRDQTKELWTEGNDKEQLKAYEKKRDQKRAKVLKSMKEAMSHLDIEDIKAVLDEFNIKLTVEGIEKE